MTDTESKHEPLVVADAISRKYTDGDVLALDEVSLAIHHGDFIAIVGPSGSGKSTLLNLLGGLDQPTSGQVRFGGVCITSGRALDQLRSQQIGYVFQSFYLLPTLTAIENVQIPMFETSRSAKERSKRATELLDVVGMSHRRDHLPSRLSVGERQRVAIARSLANDPQLLLADEPTGNLDSNTGEEILELFESLHRDRGMTIVLITHSHEVAERAERVIEVRDGRICRDETSAAMKNK
ncbi:MAG: ABC transporter ATP-binding protein [Planctomycetota bacterium]